MKCLVFLTITILHHIYQQTDMTSSIPNLGALPTLIQALRPRQLTVQLRSAQQQCQFSEQPGGVYSLKIDLQLQKPYGIYKNNPLPLAM